MMDAQYLKEMCNMTRKVKMMQVKLIEMKSDLFSIGSISFGERVQRTKSNDPMGNKIAAYVDFENKYYEYLDRYFEKYVELYAAIRELDIVNQMYVISHCFLGREHFQIADDMGVSENTVYRIRRDTLKELEALK